MVETINYENFVNKRYKPKLVFKASFWWRHTHVYTCLSIYFVLSWRHMLAKSTFSARCSWHVIYNCVSCILLSISCINNDCCFVQTVSPRWVSGRQEVPRRGFHQRDRGQITGLCSLMGLNGSQIHGPCSLMGWIPDGLWVEVPISGLKPEIWYWPWHLALYLQLLFNVLKSVFTKF